MKLLDRRLRENFPFYFSFILLCIWSIPYLLVVGFWFWFGFSPVRKQSHKSTAVIGNPVVVSYFFFVDVFRKRRSLGTDLERRVYVHQ